MIDKRQQILQATSDMIAEYGLQACPMSKISARAGCGAGTIYRYFETKEELVKSLFQDLIERLTSACLQNYDPDQPLRERFYRIWGNYYHFVLANPGERALMEQLFASPLICNNQRDHALNTLQLAIGQLLDDGKRQGVFKDVSNEILNTITYGSLVTITKKLHQSPEKFTTEVTADVVLGICWDAIRC